MRYLTERRSGHDGLAGSASLSRGVRLEAADVASTHYQVLGLDDDATAAAIVAAYRSRKAALESTREHASRSDRRRCDGNLAMVERAYAVLADPDTRDAYDALLAERSLGEAARPSVSEMTIRDFYGDPARSDSREISFGSWLRQGTGPWKVVWLEATGELVAFNESGRQSTPGIGMVGGGNNLLLDLTVGIAAEVAIDGLVHAVSNAGASRMRLSEVYIIAVQPDLDRLTSALAGWQEHVLERDGVTWLAERAGG
jgi:hypothetical protein